MREIQKSSNGKLTPDALCTLHVTLWMKRTGIKMKYINKLRKEKLDGPNPW